MIRPLIMIPIRGGSRSPAGKPGAAAPCTPPRPGARAVTPLAWAIPALLVGLTTTAAAPAADPAPLSTPAVSRPLLGITPPPAAEDVDPRVTIELRLASEPDATRLEEETWIRITGSISGLRLRGESVLTILPAGGGGESHVLRVDTGRPFLPGEEVRLELKSGLPVADGRRLPGVFATFRIQARPHQTAPRPTRRAVFGLQSPAGFSGQGSPNTSAPERGAGPPVQTGRLAPALDRTQNLRAGLGPNLAVPADFNRDGYVDLIVSESLGEGRLHLFHNNGLGQLAAHSTVTIPGISRPGRFAIGDIDHDGWLDVAVIGQQSGNLAVLLGEEDGGFKIASTIDLAARTPVQALIVDLDMDGRNDIVVADLEGNRLSILRGDPSAPNDFRPEQRLPALPGVQSMVAGDFDGDLRPDLALVSEETGTLGLLLSAQPPATAGGELTFARALAVPVGRRPESIVAGDLDRDGSSDLIVLHGGSNDAAVLLGRGDGTFEAPVPYEVGDRPAIAALADLDADGDLDLIVPNLFSDDVTLLIGDGEGGFERTERLPVEAGPVAVAAADFEGDGDLDLAVVNSVADRVALYANRIDERGAWPGGEPPAISQNNPNPFNPGTTITFTLEEPQYVNIVVFGTSGKLVKHLVDEWRPAGENAIFWDSSNDAGDKVPSGIYFYRLTTEDAVELRRMTLLR